MSSPFDVLGIDPDADEEEVERAYRRRVKETHPDHGGSARAFQVVRAAYEAIQAGNADADADDEVTIDPDATDDEDPDPEPRVEFLNYAVLDDHGWSLDDPNLFEKAAGAELDAADYGRFSVESHESLLEAAENRGFTWPYACRGGACANCAVALAAGELSMPVDHILPSDLLDQGIRLSCVGAPATDELRVVYNVKHLPTLDDLRLPPGPFEGARSDD